MFSYDPPEHSLAELMSNAIDESEEEVGADPTQDAAVSLHSALLLHGQRHHLEAARDTRQVVLRMPPDTARWLASLAADAWKPRRT